MWCEKGQTFFHFHVLRWVGPEVYFELSTPGLEIPQSPRRSTPPPFTNTQAEILGHHPFFLVFFCPLVTLRFLHKFGATFFSLAHSKPRPKYLLLYPRPV